MALLRFSPDLDPMSNLLTLQAELERFLRNPAIRLGVSGPGDFPPVNIFDDGDGVVVMAEIPGMDPASLNVSGQSHTLTIKGERKRETVGDANRVLQESRIFIGIGMTNRRTEVLNVVAWYLMRVSAQRSQLKTCNHGNKGKRIHLNVVVDIFPAKKRWEVVVGPGHHGVPAKLPGVASALETEGFGKVQPMLSSLAGQDRGSSKSVNDAGDFRPHRRRVAAGLLQVVGKLGT